MIRSIIQIGDPVLEKRAEEVKDLNDPKINNLILDMLDTCKALELRSAGLSAPQLGESLQICVCRRVDLEEQMDENYDRKKDKSLLPDEKLWEIMINPKILNFSKEESIFWEGCLSVGIEEKDTIYGPVARPDDVEIEYMNREGGLQKIMASGFFSHVVQHEIDHLNGILFLSRVERPEVNLWKAQRLDGYIKKHGEYPDVE